MAGKYVFIEGNPDLETRLADTASAANGAGLVAFLASLNYLPSTVGEAIQDGEINVMWFVTSEAARQDIKTGAGLVDVSSYMDAATSFALSLKKSLFLPAGMWKRTTTWVIPPYVGVRGESIGWPSPVFDPANSWRFGPVIYKAHTGHGITKTGVSAYDTAAPIINISVSSSRLLYPGGSGIVLDKTGTCDLDRCMVFGCGGDGIVIGVTAGDVTGHTTLRRCYVNNCTGKAYNIRAKWCTIDTVLSDGCTHGLYLDTAPETRIVNCHFEGFSTVGVRFANACGGSKFVGKTFIGNTGNAPAGVIADNVAGNSLLGISGLKLVGPSTTTAITFTGALVAATSATLTAAWAGTTGSYGLYFSDGSVKTATLTNGSTAVSWTGAVTATASASAMSSPTSIAIDLQGASALACTVQDNEIDYWATGVKDNGTTRTRIIDNDFYQCGLPIYANSSSTRYAGNVFDTTTGQYDIEHIGGGGGGIWSQNIGSKAYKATSTGTPGFFGTNLVQDNKGFKTKNSGTTGLISSGTTIAHGLATGLVPARVDFMVYSGTYSNLGVSAIDATNITISFSGGGTIQVQWRVEATCEIQ